MIAAREHIPENGSYKRNEMKRIVCGRRPGGIQKQAGTSSKVDFSVFISGEFPQEAYHTLGQ
jgi:hypothetical protein